MELRVGLIGFGAIGRRVADGLAAPPVAVLVHSRRTAADASFVYTIEDLLAARPDVIVEAATPDALATYILPIVESGATLIATSGAGLHDPTLRKQVELACQRSGARLVLPAGALAGLDALSASAIGGLERVLVRVTDPSPTQPPYQGEAWEGVRRAPGRLNVVAAAALAAGPDAHVELEVRNGTPHELHIEASGAFGEFSATLRPRTIHVVAFSVLQTLQQLAGPAHRVVRPRTDSAPD